MSVNTQLSALFLLPVVVILGPSVAGIFLWWQRKRRRARARSPLTSDLLRPPGYSVWLEIDGLRDKVDELLIFLITLPLVLYAAILAPAMMQPERRSMGSTLLFTVGTLVVVAITVTRLLKLVRRLDRMRVGWDAEVAVGQELDQLMRQGAVVFHDVPAEKFNIDHVVICDAGVYAVETKGRSKPIRGRGSEDATLEFDGESLVFPMWRETRPLLQALDQSRWLQKWLSSAVGASVSVKPVLAIPGWFIKRSAPSAVLLYNGRNPSFLLKYSTVLTEEMKKRIAHQLDQRCRNVKPSKF